MLGKTSTTERRALARGKMELVTMGARDHQPYTKSIPFLWALRVSLGSGKRTVGGCDGNPFFHIPLHSFPFQADWNGNPRATCKLHIKEDELLSARSCENS